ncbi:hypothetical protein ASG35_22815 [Burkholderia sp. Leaf177]|nr:hypothetical protein ASG35_22815 [Burkholderia sp. Leaf177]
MICKTLVSLEMARKQRLTTHRPLNNYSFAICLSGDALYGLHERASNRFHFEITLVQLYKSGSSVLRS